MTWGEALEARRLRGLVEQEKTTSGLRSRQSGIGYGLSGTGTGSGSGREGRRRSAERSSRDARPYPIQLRQHVVLSLPDAGL